LLVLVYINITNSKIVKKLTTILTIITKGEDLCLNDIKDVKTLETKSIPARPAQLGSTELRFKCVDKGGKSKAFANDIKEIRYRQYVFKY